VIYDANAGKITGGRWFNSPAGAYAADPRFAGKANFGFNAQYKGDASVPTGEFQFSVGTFSFHSTAYDWVVVVGDTAQLQGTGTANGRTYAFQLTILDGTHAGRPDRIRIKMWDPLSGLVAYNSQPGANEVDNPLTTLGGGQAMIHG
jgi:large repetitive protein